MTTQFNKLLACKGFFASSVALVLAGCAGDGTGLDANGRPISDTPAANGDFQEIQDTIFTPICTACHVGAGAPQGLRLDAGNSYALLVNVASAEVPGTLRVNPGNPDASYLVQKIEGTAAVGVRMPANGPPYLPQDRIDLVRRWIAAGAPMTSAPPDRLIVTSTIPAVSEIRGSGTRKTHRHLQRQRRQLTRERRHLHAARRRRSARERWPACAFRRAGKTWSNSPRRNRSPPAAISSPCMAMDPRRSPTKPVTCSTATPTASPAATCSFPSMSTQETPDDPPRRFSARLLGVLALIAFAGTANAEPYLAAQMGLKCVQCHVNPTGGGMRSVFGNTFAQTQLAAKKIGSDEDLWTGQVMKFLSVGGNARANYSFSDVPHQSSTNDFAVEEARAYLDFGVIPNRLSVYIDQRFAPGNSTNLEANIRYWISENSVYVKAGRMYQPFGYRFEDDNAFVRQMSGFNMQAPDEGIEVGFEKGSWTTQVALSNGTGRRAGSGRRQADRGAHRIRRLRLAHGRERGCSTTPTRAIASAPACSARFAQGPVTFLGEVDYFDDDSIGADGRKLMASLVEADWKVLQGHNVKLTFEWLEPDTDVDEDEQTRTSLLYEWSPIQFIQLRGGVRMYDGIPQNDLQNRTQAFVQLHGFF